jgi:hypothetical protein
LNEQLRNLEKKLTETNAEAAAADKARKEAAAKLQQEKAKLEKAAKA